MNKIAMQRCCTTPHMLTQYETSTDSVLRALGVEPIDIKGFGCCGYPLKHFNFSAYLLSSAKNISLAEREGLDILTFCNCCYGSLRQALHYLQDDNSLRGKTNKVLAQEGLEVAGRSEIKHLLHYLYSIRARIHSAPKTMFKGLKLAVHYGCQILRPRQLVEFGGERPPTYFDELVGLVGAESVAWYAKLDCCGAPILGVNNEIALKLLGKKISSAKASGAHAFCVACPYCQIQFDLVQRQMLDSGELKESLPSILFTQLLGLSLGLDPQLLGIDRNKVDMSWIRNFLPPAPAAADISA